MSRPQRALTVAEARAIDLEAHERFGMPTALLMENAARSVADVARLMGRRFVILCGAGNNGGDGLAVARHLGFARCAIHLLGEPDPARAPDAALQREMRQLKAEREAQAQRLAELGAAGGGRVGAAGRLADLADGKRGGDAAQRGLPPRGSAAGHCHATLAVSAHASEMVLIDNENPRRCVRVLLCPSSQPR